MIRTYEDALAAIGTMAADAEFPAADMTIKPTDNLRAPVFESKIERLLLDRAAAITFE